MRISKASLDKRWIWSSGLALLVFAVLAVLEMQLRRLTGVATSDLGDLSSAAQFRAAFFAWAPQPYAVRAGFDLGLDYLLMPLYAASFFYSGVIAAEYFAPRPGRLRRLILLAAMAPFAGALCDMAENTLHLTMLLGGANDMLAGIAHMASSIKNAALLIGIVLAIGAVAARYLLRRASRPA